MTYTTNTPTNDTSQPYRRTSWLIRLLLAAFNLYAFVILIGLALRLLIGEQLIAEIRITRYFIDGSFTPVGLFNSLIPPLLLPALVIIPLCILLRRPRYAILHIPILLVFIANYGMMFLPRDARVQAADDTPSLKVMSYNVWVGAYDFDPMIEIIHHANPDVIAFQELTDRAWAAFDAALSKEYPYQAIYTGGNTTSGMGLISRYPIIDEEMWADVNAQQQAVIQVGDTPVTVFNFHPPIPTLYGVNAKWRDQVIAGLLERASTAPKPLVLIGDFNMGDFSEAYGRVTVDYTDAFRAAGRGLGLSFPDFGNRYAENPMSVLPPLARLDYIFYSEGLRAVEAWTSHTSGGSDHRPVYAELVLTGEQ